MNYTELVCYRNSKMDGAGGYSGNVEEGMGGASRSPQNQGNNKRLQQTQAKVDEVRNPDYR